MISVLIIHPFDAIAGSQRVAVNIAKALQTDGYSADVRLGFGSDGFLSRWKSTKTFLAINNRQFRKLLYPLWLLVIMPRMARAVFAGEVVWANTVHAAPATLLAVLLAPKRVVIQIHEIEFPHIFLTFIRFAARRGTTLVCVSDFQRRMLAIDAQVLPNCVSIPNIESQQIPACNLVYVGNTSAAKGFSLFIDVASLLVGSGLTPVAFLPDLKNSDLGLLAQAESAGVILHYGVTDSSRMYEGGYLSLLCTDPALSTETFSLVAVESISCLVPVASTGTRVVREILADALAFDEPTRVPEQIASAIRTLLSKPSDHARLVQACRIRRSEYSFHTFQQGLRDLVSRLA